jgi:hypothetical protein
LKIDHQRRINLSLLVKGNSFLAHNRAALSQLSVLLLCRLRQKNGMCEYEGRKAGASVTTTVVPGETIFLSICRRPSVLPLKN